MLISNLINKLRLHQFDGMKCSLEEDVFVQICYLEKESLGTYKKSVLNHAYLKYIHCITLY